MSNDKKMHSTSHGHGLIFQCSDSRTRGLRSLHDAGLFQGTKEQKLCKVYSLNIRIAIIMA